MVHNVRCSYEHSSAVCCTNLIFSETLRDRNFFRPGWKAQMQGVDCWVGVVTSARQHRPLQTEEEEEVKYELTAHLRGRVRDHSFFMREGRLVGFGKHHLKIALNPLSLPIFFTWPLILIAVIFSDDPLLQKKKKHRSRFQLFNSLLFPYFTLLCSL